MPRARAASEPKARPDAARGSAARRPPPAARSASRPRCQVPRWPGAPASTAALPCHAAVPRLRLPRTAACSIAARRHGTLLSPIWRPHWLAHWHSQATDHGTAARVAARSTAPSFLTWQSLSAFCTTHAHPTRCTHPFRTTAAEQSPPTHPEPASQPRSHSARSHRRHCAGRHTPLPSPLAPLLVCSSARPLVGFARPPVRCSRLRNSVAQLLPATATAMDPPTQDHAKKKRRRIHLNCEECRRTKSKCTSTAQRDRKSVV